MTDQVFTIIIKIIYSVYCIALLCTYSRITSSTFVVWWMRTMWCWWFGGAHYNKGQMLLLSSTRLLSLYDWGVEEHIWKIQRKRSPWCVGTSPVHTTQPLFSALLWRSVTTGKKNCEWKCNKSFFKNVSHFYERYYCQNRQLSWRMKTYRCADRSPPLRIVLHHIYLKISKYQYENTFLFVWWKSLNN